MSLFSFRRLRTSAPLLALLALAVVQSSSAIAVSGPVSPSISHTSKHYTSPHATKLVDHGTKIKDSAVPSNASVAKHVPRSIALRSPPAAIARSNDQVSQLDQYHAVMLTSLNSLIALQSLDPQDSTIPSRATNYTTSYQNAFQGFQVLLGQMQSDKGLANYDKADKIQTLLKNAINLNKNLLSTITALVYQIPTLGPILGPIVYEIKCIIDAMLDFIENVTDAVLNALGPVLRPLLNDYVSQLCGDLLGLCLNVKA
ncbi:hypothetical protein SISNIDRAFT_466363 [Sistotremastrum niveocremeum HHB9708]|uniref:Uncharacterized protein n=1 Tax=Sistotremastrum niveocremeum HHB9708 TaxID=1314777 RepID=A0A164U717_9AGAM|nr:hypothetical protein SISNIDRAFT_466363 [Sistotremastrum niveocremeum HHB9708]